MVMTPMILMLMKMVLIQVTGKFLIMKIIMILIGPLSTLMIMNNYYKDNKNNDNVDLMLTAITKSTVRVTVVVNERE